MQTITRGPYKPKKLKFTHTCESCNITYKSGDVRGRFCIECKKPKPCKCGCRKLVKTPGSYFAIGCTKRGKTYQEIHGKNDVNCGFKKGEDNIMSDPIMVKKLSESIKKSYTPELREVRRKHKLKQYDEGLVFGKPKYTNEKGEKFRSILELEFSQFLTDNNVDYEFEPKVIKLPNNKHGYLRKIPDFIIGNNIIEVTGVAYEKWLNQFKIKIKLLKQVVDNKIVILTYPDKVESLVDLIDERTFIIGMDNLQENLKIISN